ncbi:hypothetical protein GF357_02550 [Candidatus Dojkabacteria bacterium]|nr:hypothetical protein [Candidatus Dojkabacteria bacterium]
MSKSEEVQRSLLDWRKGQIPDAENFACSILQLDGYKVDPSHPYGGRDGGKAFFSQLLIISSMFVLYISRRGRRNIVR